MRTPACGHCCRRNRTPSARWLNTTAWSHRGRVAAYASEINRLKALVAKLQRMQFGKSSEKLRAKTERQIQEAQERISALQEEMAETLGEQYDPVLPSALRQSSARKPLPASLPRETRVIRPEEECCPACGGELSSLGCDVSEQLELISSAFKVIETQRPKQACCRCDHIVRRLAPYRPPRREGGFSVRNRRRRGGPACLVPLHADVR